MRAVTIAASLACLCAPACAGETHARPPAAPRARAAPTAPLPFPETAFRADASPIATPEPQPRSRFDTQRIGVEDAGGRRFHGAPVDLDVKDASITEVLRLLADVGRVDIVVASDVTGKITLRLRRVPWDQALDVVVRAKGLEAERDGDVILVRAAR